MADLFARVCARSYHRPVPGLWFFSHEAPSGEDGLVLSPSLDFEQLPYQSFIETMRGHRHPPPPSPLPRSPICRVEYLTQNRVSGTASPTEPFCVSVTVAAPFGVSICGPRCPWRSLPDAKGSHASSRLPDCSCHLSVLLWGVGRCHLVPISLL